MLLASGFSWFHLIPSIEHDELLSSLGIHEETYLIVSAWVIVAVLLLGAGAARLAFERAMARPGLEKYLPDETLTLRNAAEVYISAIRSLLRDLLGKEDAWNFFPLIGALFTYIFFNNIVGAFPGFLPPTDNINTNVGMAVTVFLVFNIVGLTRDPVGYLKHLAGPVWWIAPGLFVIEVIGLCIRPLSLSLRLTGNIFGDHAVFNVMSDLFPWYIPVPVAFLGLGMFVAFIQAFVFSLLSAIYIGLAAPHHEHDEHHH